MMLGVEPEVRASSPVDEYEQLFRAHYRAVCSYVRRVWPFVDEDNVLSRTFEIAWRRLDDVPSDAARGWLVGVARNCALNEMRASRRRATYLDAFVAIRRRASSDLFDTAVPPETSEAMQRAFAQLRDSDQDVLLLASWGGLAGEDLGAALGVSGSSAAVRLFRARGQQGGDA
jgi:RNA polymerase sigma-70 factor, ECF subfamily